MNLDTYQKKLLFFLFSAYILSFVDRQIIAVVSHQLSLDLEISNFQVGLLYGTAFSFIYAIAGIPMGVIADRVSKRAMISIGLFTWSLATVLTSFAHSYSLLIFYRMLLGLSQAMLGPAAYALLAESFAGRVRGKVFSFYASGIFIGIALSFLVGATLATEFDWRLSVFVAGLPGLILAPILFFSIKKTQTEKMLEKVIPPHFVAQLKEILSQRVVRWHLAGFAAMACMGYTVLAFVATVLSQTHQRPDLIAHFGWFLFLVAGMVVLSGVITDRLGVKKVEFRFLTSIAAALIGVPFYFIALLSSDALTALIFMGIGFSFSSSYNGVAAALIQYFVKDHARSLAGGVYLFVISVAGFGFGPPVAGLLMDHVYTGQFAPGYALLTVIVSCSVIAAFSFIRAMKSYSQA